MNNWKQLPYLDTLQKYLEKYKRSWRERLFSLPWTPWKAYEEQIYYYGIDVSKYDKPMICKTHHKNKIIVFDEIRPLTEEDMEIMLKWHNKKGGK